MLTTTPPQPRRVGTFATAVLSLCLPPCRTAPATARHAVQAALAQWPEAEDVALVVSELVTNAVEHAVPPISLRMARHRRHVYVCVCDGSAASPWQRQPVSGDEGGRGLLVTAALADRYGYRRVPQGKAIWAVLPAHDAEDDSERTASDPAKARSVRRCGS